MDGYGDPSSSVNAPTLTELLQQSKKLNAQLGAKADLPSIHLGLDQIEAQSRKIAQARATHAGLGASSVAGAGDDTKAHYFLANGGIDASGLADSINQANIAQAFEPLQPVFDTDVESYLRHSHEQIILSAIEEGRRETLADFHRGLAKAQVRDWESQKAHILEELGQHHALQREEFSQTLSQSHLGGMSGPVAGFQGNRSFVSSQYDLGDHQTLMGNSTGNSRVAKYLNAVERLNAHRLDSLPFAAASAFGEAARLSNVTPAGNAEHHQTSDLLDCWRALSHVVGEGEAINGEFKGSAVLERQYSPAYLGQESDDAWLGLEGRELRKVLITGALTFLEHYFSNHIESKIASNPVKAQLGGRSTDLGKVIAFERVTFVDREGRWSPELELIQTKDGKVPIWATIFYLLCTGNSATALDFASSNEEALRAIDGSSSSGSSFVSYFKMWLDSPDRSLPKPIRDRFLAEYNSRFRGSFAGEVVDGYKQALFKLIGRVDINKSFPASVTKDTETWLWLQLSSVRESTNDSSEYTDSLRDRLTLQDLGSRVVKFGDRHFDAKGTRPLHYFLLLLLCGQFERAVAFLYSRSQFQVDAVNFAAVLSYYGLLRVPPQSKTSHIDILTASIHSSSGQEVMMVDFAKLIQKYVRLFPHADARAALQYIYLVSLNKDLPRPVGEEQKAKCHDLIRTLIIESRQYFELLGDVRNDGTKSKGLIEHNLKLIGLDDSREFLSGIVRAAAVQSETDNRTRDAILLYNLAEEYDRVIEVINRQLGLTVVDVSNTATPDAPTAKTSLASVEDLPQLAQAILESYERQSHILRSISPSKRETCRILLTLKDCFESFAKGELEKTLNSMDLLDLIPLRGDVVTITRKAEAFKDIDESISKNLSEILLLVMNCISKLYQALKNSPYGDVNRQQVSLTIIIQCNSLTRLQRLTEYRNKARALMLFAGMLRLRVEPSTFAQLTRLDVYLH